MHWEHLYIATNGPKFIDHILKGVSGLNLMTQRRIVCGRPANTYEAGDAKCKANIFSVYNEKKKNKNKIKDKFMESMRSMN